MRTRGTGPGSAKKSPATKKAAGSKTNNNTHKSPLQTPIRQEDLDAAASCAADFQSPASNAKLPERSPDDDAVVKSAVLNGGADQSGIVRQEQSASKTQASSELQAGAGTHMTESIVDNNLGEKRDSEVTAGKPATADASTEKIIANVSGQGVERSNNGASSAAEASVKSMDIKATAEEHDKKELSEKEGKEEEEEEEEEEVEEIEEIEVEEEIEDEEGAEEEVDEEEEVEEVEMEDQEGEEEEEEVVEEEELAEGEDEEGEQEGQGDEEADLEDTEEEIEVIEEIEYEDEEEEEVEYEEEEIEVEEEDQEGGGEEEMEDVQEEAEQFAKEYPDVQQVMPVSERQKRKKMEVFVGGLDRDATEEDLKKVFERVGEVKEVRLMKSFHTGKNKGFAFVQYATAAQAQRAAIELERVQVRGRMCGVVPSEENDILFIGNLNKTWNKETVMETLKKYGLENIEELTLMEDPQHAGMNRGFAFVEFSTHKDARIGFRRLQRPNVIFGTDRPAKVAWADPVNEPDDEVMAQVKSVFVDGMPTTWDDEKAKEHFGQYGEIERIVLARNMPFAKRKDFGFVNYAAREAAVACVEGMNNTELADGDSKVKVKVKLSKPQLRTIKTVGTGLRGGYHTDWHRGRWGFRGGRFFPGRDQGAKAGWGHGYESGWGRGFEPGWVRGSGRFGFGRSRGRFGRGFFRGISRGGSFSGRYQYKNEASTAQPLLHVLKEQTAQEDSVADRAMMNYEDKNDSVTAKDRKTAKVINVEGGRPLGEKFECTMCGFASDVESEFNTHQMSRVHKIIEGMRREEKLTNKTPLSLLHEYASRHRCEVHYDIAAENALGPFEVYATIGGANTGIPSTRGVGKGHNKAKARQMAAADALEKIMIRIPDLEFGRPVQGRQRPYERPVAEMTSHNFPSSRARGPPNRSGNDFHKTFYEGSRPFAGGYGSSPSRHGNAAHLRGRLRSGHLARDERPRTRNPDLTGEFEGRTARLYGRGAIRSRYDDGEEFSESFGGGRGRGSSRGGNVLAAHREAYFQHLEQSQGQGYGSNRASAAIREYGEAVPGAKRTISALDVDPRIDNIPHRGHPRARVERIDLVSVAPGGSDYGSGSLYATSASAFQEDTYPDAQQYGLYDSHQSALDMAGIYPSSSHSYGSLYGGASNIQGSAELLAGSHYPASALHGYSQGPSVGGSYSAGGPGTGSYY